MEEKTAYKGNSAKITDAEFRELVRQMRHNQRRYFATRNQDALRISKELEKRIDEELAKDRQMALF